jgi:NADH-quinone oxidoreductase subunit L
MIARTVPGVFDLLWAIPAVPLVAAAANLFVGRRLGRAAGWLATAAVAVAFAISIAAVAALVSLPEDARTHVQHLFDWISVGSFTVSVDLRLDQVSAVMILVVTGIGSLIHLYAIGYMREDPRFGRFFAYLNLFVFFMLMLVLADDFLVLFLGWEGVGLCSYLLIGFWFETTENANAAKKAFVTNRVGDAAMLVGLALIVKELGTLGFATVLGPGAATLTSGTATAISLLLFAGAIGKSAQVPLQVWLPDAMAGPTPVSALIHAATMVTAGVYLVVRAHPLFEASPVALDVVAVVGLVTMLYAGTAALGQDDIKRALAYSTVSQLGYMFMAAGLGAYAGALFFLVAHAFYKALLFLGAGSVIEGMHHEQDMRGMGGLRRRMPITFATMAVGALALAGVPPLAGFFAKDQLLEIANHTDRVALFALGTVGAVLSAAYIGRVLFLTFFGEPRTQPAEGAREPTPLMWGPLLALAVGAAAIGLVNLTPEGALARFVEPVVGAVPEGRGLSPLSVSLIGAAIAVAMLAAAYLLYASRRVDPEAIRERLEPLPRTLAAGWYVDRWYSSFVEGPAKAVARFAAERVDAGVIDGVVDGIGAATRRLAAAGRRIQTGLARNYALALLAGAVAILAYVGFRL